jgi:hypothetical protein
MNQEHVAYDTSKEEKSAKVEELRKMTEDRLRV